MSRRPFAAARVEPGEAPARPLLARCRGAVDLEVLGLLEAENALSPTLEMGPLPRGETPVRQDVVAALRERLARRPRTRPRRSS